MIINVIGQPGSGKTTIARELLKSINNSINIDGDELRVLFDNKDYSKEGRRSNIQNAYNIAIFLESKGFVPVISLVSPFRDIRDSLKAKTNVLEVFLKTTEIRGRENFHVLEYEYPGDDTILIDTTGKDPIEMAKIIIDKI